MGHFKYKDFIGSIETSVEDGILFGKILYINGLITYEAETIPQLKTEFENAVDDYLAFCEEQEIEAYKSFTGKFNVRISSALHKQAALLATTQGITLNALVERAIQNEVISLERETSTVYQYMEQSNLLNLEIISKEKPALFNGLEHSALFQRESVEYAEMNIN